ncbi:hydroxysqualene dehydroxylase HpnE [bacterium]|nr:hydroxysqualene dehydroxylase HpnE [bacterium]
MADKPTVAVIGGGVAGLAVASLMAKHGYCVTLLERKNRLGGRTYSFVDDVTGDTIDNGQHILMGCYDYTLRWLAEIGAIDKVTVLDKYYIPFAAPHEKLSPLRFSNWPSPLHLLIGILSYKNLSINDRWKLLKAGLSMRKPVRGQISVTEWLDQNGQSDRCKKYFWQPVCLAVMNEDMDTSSAGVFVTVLKEMFLRNRDASKFILSKVGLSELFVHPAMETILHNGGSIHCNEAVQSLSITDQRLSRIETKSGNRFGAEIFISAIPVWEVRKAIPDAIFSSELPKTSPIVSIYVWLDQAVLISKLFDGEFIGCIDTHIQWIFKKQNYLSITISDADEVVSWERDRIDATVRMELQALLNIRSEHIRHIQIIKEHKATFSVTVGGQFIRPGVLTSVENLYIAGDWIETGLPSTIESAVKSAYQCVEHIEKARKGTIC